MKKWLILFEILCSLFIMIVTKGIIKTNYDYEEYFSMYLNIDGVNHGYNKITQQLSGSYFNYEQNKPFIVANEVFKANNNSYFLQYRNIINRDISFQQYNEDTKYIVNMYYYDYQKSSNSLSTLSGLSLAFKCRNDSFSFVHQLYNNSLIEKLMYIFEPVDINSGNIYFGGIPQNSLLQYSGKCKINSEKWGCYLDNIYFTNDSNKHLYLYKTNISNNYAEFDVGRKCIFAPKEYFYFVKNTFFEKHFQSKKCGYYYNYDAMYIYCYNKDEIKEAIPEYISFVFENQSFRIHKDKLFKTHTIDNTIIFLICNALFVEDLDKWIFGSAFLHNFISIFDYTNESVTLYSNIEINYFYPYTTQIKMIFIISIILTFIGSFINLLYKNFM